MDDFLELGPRLADDYLGTIELASRLAMFGHALEFGVASGTTLRIISEQTSVTGFDSFEGLPEDWREGFPKGTFAQKPPEIANAEIVVGLFEDTLPKWIDEHQYEMSRLSLVHIDCDLYSSTKTVLDNIAPYLWTGTLICFDEYHGYPGFQEHEYKAWREFVLANDIGFDVVGHGPEQLLVRIR